MQRALKTVESIFQEQGIVTAAGDDGVLTVRTASGTFEAKRAVSCLVAPEVKDVVLLAVPPEGALYVLAVLERPEPEAELKLASDRDLTLATKGTLSLSAARGVELRTAGTLETVAKLVRTTAVEAMVSVDRLGLVGRFVETHAQTVKNVLGTVDSVMERLSQHVQRSYRVVEEVDLTRAGEVDVRVQRSLSMRAENALIDAEEVVKMQAEQIHLG